LPVALCNRQTPNLWDQWLALASIDKEVHPKRLHFEKSYVAIHAAEKGLGLSLSHMSIVFEDIMEGRLVAPFSDPRLKCPPMQVLYQSPDSISSPGVAFATWLTNATGFFSQEISSFEPRAPSLSHHLYK
jgi:LysR family glycine cleavage system transcriptional activator